MWCAGTGEGGRNSKTGWRYTKMRFWLPRCDVNVRNNEHRSGGNGGEKNGEREVVKEGGRVVVKEGGREVV